MWRTPRRPGYITAARPIGCDGAGAMRRNAVSLGEPATPENRLTAQAQLTQNRIHIVDPNDIQVKSVGLRIRIEPELRDAFVQACRRTDRSAAQVLRAFMRQYVGDLELGSQKDIFDQEPSDSSNNMDKSMAETHANLRR